MYLQGAVLENVPTMSCLLSSWRIYLQGATFSALGECTYKELPSQYLQGAAFSTLGECIYNELPSQSLGECTYNELPSQLLENVPTMGCLLSLLENVPTMSCLLIRLENVPTRSFLHNSLGMYIQGAAFLVFWRMYLQEAALSAL